jgi:hypothetical protein
VIDQREKDRMRGAGQCCGSGFINSLNPDPDPAFQVNRDPWDLIPKIEKNTAEIFLNLFLK